MKTVHKFMVLHGENRIDMDRSAGLTHFDMQNGCACFWAVVDTDAPKSLRTFQIFGTGHPIPEGWVPMGSCIDGNFVWHLFEKIADLSSSRSG